MNAVDSVAITTFSRQGGTSVPRSSPRHMLCMNVAEFVAVTIVSRYGGTWLWLGGALRQHQNTSAGIADELADAPGCGWEVLGWSDSMPSSLMARRAASSSAACWASFRARSSSSAYRHITHLQRMQQS